MINMVHIRVRPKEKRKLLNLKKEYGFSSLADALALVLREFEKENKKKSELKDYLKSTI